MNASLWQTFHSTYFLMGILLSVIWHKHVKNLHEMKLNEAVIKINNQHYFNITDFTNSAESTQTFKVLFQSYWYLKIPKTRKWSTVI